MGGFMDLKTVGEAAEKLRCKRENLRKLIREGLIPVFKIGPRTQRIDVDELLKLSRREVKK
jgi:excisionase family DNA binding protein